MAGPRAQTGAALSMDWQNEKKLLIALNPLEGLRELGVEISPAEYMAMIIQIAPNLACFGRFT